VCGEKGEVEKQQLLVYVTLLSSHQETEMVNTHVTSPGATVALGLMYLKTNDMWVEQIM